MILSKALKECRAEKGWRQEDLAKYSGVSLATIKRYESGSDNATTTNLQKIASAFGVDVSFFLVPQLSLNIVPQSKKNVPQLSLNRDNPVPQPKNSPQTLNQDDFYFIPKLNITASAGGGNELEGLECYESGQTLAIDKAFFKAIPSHNIKAIRVDGYSMIPLLFPDSWVIFEEGNEFKGDGLYIINYANQLMVKLLQLNPITNILEIISTNKDYKSYEVSLGESQELCLIRGKVLRSII